tara:strand:- start:188 stop:679 length:492 start_codon:yes stop_codon:yes gene_type:complete
MLDMSSKPVIDYRVITSIGPTISGDMLYLGKMAHAESSFSRLEFSSDKLLAVAANNANDPDRVIFMAYNGDAPVGVFVGNVSSYYFGPDLVAVDTIWYVIPEQRGTYVGIKLLELFENWAKSKGAVDIRIGQSSTIKPEVFEGLLEKRGYKFIGANYRMGTKS